MHDTISETSTSLRTRFLIEGKSYQAVLFNSPDDPLFPEIGGTSLFLSKGYHKALKAAPPDKMKFYYIRIDHEDELIGMLCFQIHDFNPGASLKNQVTNRRMSRVRYFLASMINLKVLCLGNTLVTGDYGFCFDDHIPDKLRTILMMESIDWILGQKEFRNINMVFVKDFYEDIFKEIPESSYCKKYHFIDTQPSMIMDIPKHWNGLEGYLDSLKSKYRIRAKHSLHKAEMLERVELNLEEIEKVEGHLYDLYLKVVDDVGFNLFILSPDYFGSLKRSLGDKFHLWVYKERSEIISFFTVFEDRDILDAHFLGYDQDVNHRYQLYMNMLLAMIDFASQNGFRQLQLSRTATEIKSSVGAEGIPMWAYLRFPNRLLNQWVSFIYSFFKPDLSWVRRSPFREI